MGLDNRSYSLILNGVKELSCKKERLMVFTRTERHRAGLKGFSDYNSALNITNAGIIKQEFGKVINRSPRCLSEGSL